MNRRIVFLAILLLTALALAGCSLPGGAPTAKAPAALPSPSPQQQQPPAPQPTQPPAVSPTPAQGNANAIQPLARVYEQGLFGISPDPAKAAYWNKRIKH